MALKGKFCAKCGIEAKNLVNNTCAECFLELHEVKIPKSKEVKLCSKCGSILVDHFWVTVGKQNRDVYSDQVKKAMRFPDEIKIVKVDLIKIDTLGSIEVTYDIQGNILSKEYPCNLKVQKQLCPICKADIKTENKAKLQFRTTQDAEKFISEMLEELSHFKKHIVKISELKKGIDVTAISRPSSTKLARHFKQKYGLHMSESREEYSWNRAKGRPKYKSTILLKKK